MITVPGRNVTYRLIRLDTSGKHKHWQWQQQNCSYLFYALGSRLTRKTTKLFTRESASDGLTVSAPAAYIITLILLPDKYQEIYSFNTFSSKWNLESCSRFPWASCSMWELVHVSGLSARLLERAFLDGKEQCGIKSLSRDTSVSIIVEEILCFL